jgi:hypothetical protein
MSEEVGDGVEDPGGVMSSAKRVERKVESTKAAKRESERSEAYPARPPP